MGGGRRNPVIMRELRARVNAPVLSAEDANWDGDFIEAEAFAYLAMRSVKGLAAQPAARQPACAQPMTGGKRTGMSAARRGNFADRGSRIAAA